MRTSPPPRRGGPAAGAARASPCRWAARRGARRPPPGRRRAPASRSRRTTIRSAGTPAYFMRTASSSARVPAQVTRRRRPASTSKSASQTHETSRPSAVWSLRTPSRSCSPGLEDERAQHLVGARRVLDQQDRQLGRPEGDGLGAAEGGLDGLQARHDVGQRGTEREGERGRGERVVDVVEARERQRHPGLTGGRDEREGGAARAVQLDGRAADGRLGAPRVPGRAVVVAEVAEVDGVVDVGRAAAPAVLGVRGVLHRARRPSRRRRRRSRSRRDGRGRGRRPAGRRR